MAVGASAVVHERLYRCSSTSTTARERVFGNQPNIDRRNIATSNELMNKDETLSARKRLLGNNLSISYRNPLKIVRGEMQYLFDDDGRSEEHTSELQSHSFISYAVFCLKK